MAQPPSSPGPAPCASPAICAPAGLQALLFADGPFEYALLEWPVSVPPLAARFGDAEGEVLRALAAGLSNTEIARARRRSPRTIANQVARIYRRLGVRSRLELFALLSAGRRPEGPA